MTEISQVPTSEIVPGQNDRTVFDPQALQELAASIREHGLAQPITVRPVFLCGECETALGEEPEHCPACGAARFFPRFQIVAGERRFRAMGLLGWESVPAIVRPMGDEEASAVMLAENVARADLDVIDEGRAYARRMDAFGWSAQEVADRAGVSVVRVRFRLKLLDLRPEVQKLVRDAQLPLGYAQILADAGLDANRQLIAIRHLRDNPSPSPAWFRRTVNALLEEQAQGCLFDLPLLGGDVTCAMPAPAFVEPPHPATSRPPRQGQTPAEVLRGQASYWNEAAAAWDLLGKPFKRQECEAAAQALQLALAAL
jgi:ParB-like chromosome segregation protein Spo0J